MAPESLEGRLSRGSDIWSLGVVAYEAMMGVRPFTAVSNMILPVVIVEGKYNRIPYGTNGYSNGLIDLVHLMLEKEEARRPTAQDIINALNKMN
jgi:serine/threonine protein kinase